MLITPRSAASRIFGAGFILLALAGFCEEPSMEDFFATQYEEPVIERHKGGHAEVFPSLAFFSVYEKRNAVEDPLIPDVWIQTTKGNYHRNNDIEQALKEEGLFPQNRNQALTYAVQLVRIKFGVYYCLTDLTESDSSIPSEYHQERYLPLIRETSDGYTVQLHFFHPQQRFASFRSLYKNALVEYLVVNNGATYRIISGQGRTEGMSKDEKQLTDTLIDHINAKDLMDDISPWIARLAVYGISDPPDPAGSQQRREELARLYERSMRKRHGEIQELARRVLENSPGFRFNLEDILLRTKDSQIDIKGMSYSIALGHLLQAIVIHEAPNGMQAHQ